MNTFKGGGSKTGGLKFGGKKKFKDSNRYGSERRENRSARQGTDQFAATCSECRKSCDVPFKPSNNKPVYCSACFGMKKSANDARDTNNRNNHFDRGSHTEQPHYTKPPRDQRSPRHDPSRGRSDDGMADLKRQITGLELKLNRILDIINPPLPSPKATAASLEVASIDTDTENVEKKTAPKVVKKAVTKKVTTKKAAVQKVTKKAAASPKKTVKKVAKKVSTKKTTAKAAKK